MARIHMIKKARKQTQCCKCNKIIEVGMSYLKATPYHRRPIIRCTECGLESYETSGSDYIRNVGDIANHWEENFGLSEGVHDDIARIETDKEDFEQLLKHKEEIVKELKKIGYDYITLDLEGFRSGSMDKEEKGI